MAPLVLLVAYPLSYGPVARLRCQSRIPMAALWIYGPLDAALQHSPGVVQDAWLAYYWWWVEDVAPGF